jgi:membrane peptidoglycan carboxypeptidase
MTPHLMAQIRDSQGNLVTNFGLKPWMRATTQATAAAITPLMEEVVTSGTAGQVGFLPEDQVAAKTGTAQAGQQNQLVTAWMIAFAPASQPRVAIAVVLPDQAFDVTGAKAAGPVMKAMIEAALALTGPLPPVSPAPHYTPPPPAGATTTTTAKAPGATTTSTAAGAGTTTTTPPTTAPAATTTSPPSTTAPTTAPPPPTT